MDVQVGDVIQTKKPHPCGANRFDVLRVGMDFFVNVGAVPKGGPPSQGRQRAVFQVGPYASPGREGG